MSSIKSIAVKEKLEQKQRDLIALLAKHQGAAETSGDEKQTTKTKPKADSVIPDLKRSGISVASSSGTLSETWQKKTSMVYQEELASRFEVELLLEQAATDHAAALAAKDEKITALTDLLLRKENDLEAVHMQKKTIAYYGNILTTNLNIILDEKPCRFSRQEKNLLSKVTATLSYLLADGDITRPDIDLTLKMESIPTSGEQDNLSVIGHGNSSNSFSESVKLKVSGEKKDLFSDKQKAIEKAVAIRRGSLNAVPFEAMLLYDTTDYGTITTDDGTTSSSTLETDCSAGYRPIRARVRNQSVFLPDGSLCADIINANRSGSLNDTSVSIVPPDFDRDTNTDLMVTTAVMCQCKAKSSFAILPQALEEGCFRLFQTVFHRSQQQFDAHTKVLIPMDVPPMECVNQWIGKSTFLIFCIVTNLVDSKLTIQNCLYAFEKASRDNVARGQYKLNLRLYYEDFVLALQSLAAFKYNDHSASIGDSVTAAEGGNEVLVPDAEKNSDRHVSDSALQKLRQLVKYCLQSIAMQHEMVYFELVSIFQYLKNPQYFTSFCNAQPFLLQTYKRCVNYASLYDGFEANLKRNWPIHTAANGGKFNTDTDLESNGKGFYYFCKAYKIFPILTQDSTCRRVAQHVRKICDDSNTTFFAGLIYLSTCLARNMENSTRIFNGHTETLAEGGADAFVHTLSQVEPQLCFRMTSILERVLVQIESVTLQLDHAKS